MYTKLPTSPTMELGFKVTTEASWLCSYATPTDQSNQPLIQVQRSPPPELEVPRSLLSSLWVRKDLLVSALSSMCPVSVSRKWPWNLYLLSYIGPGALTLLTQEVLHVRIPSLLSTFPATFLFPTCRRSARLSVPSTSPSLLSTRAYSSPDRSFETQARLCHHRAQNSPDQLSNQNQMSYHFTPRGMATIKKTDITHVGQAVEKLES